MKQWLMANPVSEISSRLGIFQNEFGIFNSTYDAPVS